MSFSSEIKTKLCSAKLSCNACRIAETAGILRFTGAIYEDRIKFSTENSYVAERLCADLKESFGIDVQPEYGLRSYVFLINDRYETENIKGFIESDDIMPFACCRSSFVRGAFLGGGSISDPEKSYHMEFGTKSEAEAENLCKILKQEGFSPKIAQRKGKKIVYIKECEQIADILGYIGAGQGALEMFTVQVEKQMRNEVNRRVNCENANMDKSAKASSRHMYAIKKIKNAGTWDKLPEVLREIGELREANPDISLKELGEKTNPPIGKSGVNHRLNRIMEIAEELG